MKVESNLNKLLHPNHCNIIVDEVLNRDNIEDKGITHSYIKPRSPQLNGKVERSHRTDKEEFYQLLSYTDDVDLNKKLNEWENFYNFNRPHTAFGGNTPYEALSSLLKL